MSNLSSAVELELSEQLRKYVEKGANKPLFFELVNAGKKDPLRDNAPAFHGASFPPETTIIDKYEKNPQKRVKIIRNVVGMEGHTDGNGNRVMREAVDYVRFGKQGKLVVFPHEYQKIAYLRCSNNCGTNPDRDVTQPVHWNEVKPEMGAMDKMRQADFQIEAELFAKDMPMEDALAYAKDLDIPTNGRNSSDIRWDLRQTAKHLGRQFLEQAPSDKAKLSLIVSDAKFYNYLLENTAERTFAIKGSEPFLMWEVGERPEEALVAFLATKEGEGAKKAQKVLKELQKLVESVDA